MSIQASKKLAVIPAKAEDIQFCVSLAKQESRAVGFIPKPRIAEQIGKGRILVLKRGNVRVGYLYYSVNRNRTTIKILQIVVRPDMRRKGCGKRLVDAVKESAPGATLITLRCSEDLDARHFWESVGFSRGAAHCSTNFRKRVRRIRIVGWSKATGRARFLFHL